MTLPLFERARRHADRIAIAAMEGTFSYRALSDAADRVAASLLGDRPDLGGDRVCFLVTPGWSYAAVQWGIWRAGGVAVPMATSHPSPELAHVISDADPVAVIADPEFEPRMLEAIAGRSLGIASLVALLQPGPSRTLPNLDPARPAMILYTSGTTGRPKGAVLAHANLQAQVESLSSAWGWTPDDRVLLHLPLHHVHGIVNALTCALWNGAVCEIRPRFEPVDVWERLSSGDVTLYMGVPTTYARLLDTWDSAPPATRERWSSGVRACRLMISGSAALPVPTLERWESITGHRLLERYGMTEIGMALSNPLVGERHAGFVGTPLPSVQVRLVDDAGAPVGDGKPGQVEVRGPTVFSAYWHRPEETAAAFTEDGWFRTGDFGVVEDGAYRILGRSSVDILKTGGEKISALEIEDVLRSHEAVADCAVVGIADDRWGQRVCAAVVRRRAAEVSEEELRTFAKSRLAAYKVPKQFLLVADLPRNPMGKVTKPAVQALFESPER